MSTCKVKYIEDRLRKTNPQLADELTDKHIQIFDYVSESKAFNKKEGMYFLNKEGTKKRTAQEKVINTINVNFGDVASIKRNDKGDYFSTNLLEDNYIKYLFGDKKEENASVLLKKIVDSNYALKDLASKLLPLLKTDFKVTLVPLVGNNEDYHGEYSNLTREIKLKETAFNPIRVILHEVIHGLSEMQLKNFSNPEITQHFNELFEYAKGMSNSKLYGMTNPSEFLVALFTDVNTINLLKEIPPMDTTKKYSNLFEEIFDFILNLLNFTKENSSLYEQAFSTATNIISEQYKYTDTKGNRVLNQREKDYIPILYQNISNLQELYSSEDYLDRAYMKIQALERTIDYMKESMVFNEQKRFVDQSDTMHYNVLHSSYINPDSKLFPYLQGYQGFVKFLVNDGQFEANANLEYELDLQPITNEEALSLYNKNLESFKDYIDLIEQEQILEDLKSFKEEKDNIKNLQDQADAFIKSGILFNMDETDLNSVETIKPEKYVSNNTTQFQNQSSEGIIASEKTIRDLAARMSDRIGMSIKIESDRTKEYKGKVENNTAYINLAYATLDTPIHEILGHPIIRAIKTGSKFQIEENLTEKDADKIIEKNQIIEKNGIRYLAAYNAPDGTIIYRYDKTIQTKPNIPLYQNLLKELETGKGKEVLDRIKRDYNVKGNIFNPEWYIKNKASRSVSKGSDSYRANYNQNTKELDYSYNGTPITEKEYIDNTQDYYTLEEQQEEAIVELLGMMTAEKLDAVKDGKLISLLKRLLKEIKAFMKSLLKQKEVEIDKLPDNMTLGDLSDLLAYSNSKLILPGNEVIYTTPDNMQFKTYSEASNHISDLAKSVEDVNLDNVELGGNQEVPENLKWEFENQGKTYKELIENKQWKISDDTGNTQIVANQEYKGDIGGLYWDGNNYYHLSNIDDKKTIIPFDEFIEYFSKIKQFGVNKDKLYQDRIVELSEYDQKKINPFKEFIEKNKEYEQSKEIIEEWKKVNNIQYNPEEIYSRGQEFVSVVGAYSNFDVDLMMQNLLQHIEDNKKAGGKFAISAFTKPIDKTIGHLEGRGGKIKFKIYPQSKDILWASNIDVYSGSTTINGISASKAVSNKLSELVGVSFLKYPSLNNINAVQPNLASVVDNLAHHHNELGIALTGNNFRLEYDEDIPYQTKKIIDNINKILDQKYGRLVKPEIKTKKDLTFEEKRLIELNKAKVKPSFLYDNKWEIEGFDMEYYESKQEAEEALFFFKKNLKERISDKEYFDPTFKSNLPIQPTQTKDNLKESIDSIKNTQLQRKTAYSVKEGNILRSEGWKSVGFNQELEEEYFEKPDTKEYTSQALINTKIAKLKEVAKKYPRSLIRSEVKPIYTSSSQELYDQFEGDELPFQKIPSKEITLNINNQDIEKLSNLPTNIQEYMLSLSKEDLSKVIDVLKEYDNLDYLPDDNTYIDMLKCKI
jgi:hypothetical protein